MVILLLLLLLLLGDATHCAPLCLRVDERGVPVRQHPLALNPSHGDRDPAGEVLVVDLMAVVAHRL
eukprot:COSAG05_NODE_8_length_40675_cov_148.837539_36_plen_66_part_00